MRQSCLHGHASAPFGANSHSFVAKLTVGLQKVSSRQPDAIGGVMKRNTTVYTSGAKLFSFFLGGVCVLFLALLMLNGALQKAQMFLVAACVLAVADYYVRQPSLSPCPFHSAFSGICQNLDSFR